MRKTLTMLAVATILSACDSEGIDRADLVINNPSTQNDGTTTNNNSTNPTVGTESGNNNDVNPFGGSGSSDGGNTVNPFGGSGSSDGGNNNNENTDSNAGENNSNNTANDTVDASLSLSAPTSGTTYVSTMSPIESTQRELCIEPKKDENNNVVMNGNCPVVQFHGNLKFGDFILATNAWNFCASSSPDWKQCISVDNNSGVVKPRWDYDWHNESDVRGAVWLVKSYPEIIYGIKSPGEYSGSSLAATPNETGLPARVDNLPFYKIDYTFSSDEYPTRSKDFNGSTLNGERNVAIESFFHELGGECDVNTLVRNGTSSNQRFEIMVWLDKGAERLPAAPNDYVTSVSLDGSMYDVYTKPSDREYIAFVAQNPKASGQINWTTFVEWSRSYSHRVNEVFGRGSNTVQIKDSWCMANILLGTEIWWGNGYFQADEWTIHRTVR